MDDGLHDGRKSHAVEVSIPAIILGRGDAAGIVSRVCSGQRGHLEVSDGVAWRINRTGWDPVEAERSGAEAAGNSGDARISGSRPTNYHGFLSTRRDAGAIGL